MQNKRVIISGGNSGIGFVAARELAAQGAELILLGRDSDKTRQALQAINATAAIPAVNVAVDFADQQSIRAAATALLERYDHIDVLINNAGTFTARQQHTAEGYEMQFGVNHLAPFLLTNLLLERLQASAPARIITVTSMLHKKASLDFDSFKGTDNYSAQTAYNQSKLANVLFGVELAQRLAGTGVTSNVLHPGAVATDIVRDMPWLVRKILGVVFISAEKGAQTTIMLASDAALDSVSGKYYNQCKLDNYAPVADDDGLRNQLWQVSTAAVGIA